MNVVEETTESYEVTVEGSAGGDDEVSGATDVDSVGGQ